MSEEHDFVVDKIQARLAFDHAASSYDEAAILQAEVGERILSRLDYIKTTPTRILDVGAGTGHGMLRLNRRYPKAKIFALDVSHNMLLQARNKQSLLRRLKRKNAFVCGDAEQLSLADACIDLVYSNLALQWCGELDHAFKEFYRVLKPDGLLMFSTFGPDTLKELKACWSKVDSYTHINTFIDMHDVGDALLRNNFAEPVMDMEMLTLTYNNVPAIMQDLKRIGAHNVTKGRARGLTGKGRINAVIEAYESYRCNNVLPVTHEVVYGHAWKAETLRQQNLSNDVIEISVEQLRSSCDK